MFVSLHVSSSLIKLFVRSRHLVESFNFFAAKCLTLISISTAMSRNMSHQPLWAPRPPIKGAFLVKEDRVLKGPLGSSLRSFARTAHSAHSLRNTTLASLARSVHGLAHSHCSLPRRTVEILGNVFMLKPRSMGTNAFLIFTRNLPHPL